ncbi:MAG: endonuclease/exonuclease/phosphatase family protein [Syntrophobacteraceae bacterium]|jgi:endonuclease/exonuclease/phosphatase family metal-dependent hydrolase|nr:endonuclease/exonuclease/phosphatase family protein [Syntrophobacteraceae bacterium]
MRVMTFNLRFDNEGDGENRWINRRRLAAQVVQRLGPDLLGTQEGTPAQLDDLQCSLPGYGMASGARPSDDMTCQYPTLYYRQDRFRCIESDDLWLSSTPRAHRSKDWDSAFPRLMSYALLEDLPRGRELMVVVTHLDHMGQTARLEQARLIRAWWSQRRAPGVLMGDFNDAPGSAVHRILTGAPHGWVDTWVALGYGEGVESMTHHDFSGNAEKCRMDWVLATPELRSLMAFIVRDHLEGRYPSDHFPYVVDLDWK